ncbi:glycosyltransferase family 9 protein [Sulfurimonas sp.]|uniref:glycosyltransferase family 9 protein n=1 Tax=Sulfurimonas sp. TaxID=2022749 RepID=UPI0035698FD8
MKNEICLFIKMIYSVENYIVKIFTSILFNNNNIFSADNILIFRTGSFGDSLCALPSIQIIRENFPNANIDILTNSGGNNLVSIKALIKDEIVNNIIDYTSLPKKTVYQKLKENNYNLFIDLTQDSINIKTIFRNMFIVKLLRIKSAFGWSINSIKLFSKYQNDCIKFEQETFRLINMLKRYKFNINEIRYPLKITMNDEKVVETILENNNLIDKNKNIVFIVGAKRESNRWPINYFNEVAEYLVKEGYNILCIGGKEDFALVQQINVSENFYNFTGQLTPMQSAIILKRSKLAISNDTGPMHLSYIVNTPVIAIFSSRDYKHKWYPIDSTFAKNKVYRNDNVNCINCFTEKCINDNLCMMEITPNLIINELNYYEV